MRSDASVGDRMCIATGAVREGSAMYADSLPARYALLRYVSCAMSADCGSGGTAGSLPSVGA